MAISWTRFLAISWWVLLGVVCGVRHLVGGGLFCLASLGARPGARFFRLGGFGAGLRARFFCLAGFGVGLRARCFLCGFFDRFLGAGRFGDLDFRSVGV